MYVQDENFIAEIHEGQGQLGFWVLKQMNRHFDIYSKQQFNTISTQINQYDEQQCTLIQNVTNKPNKMPLQEPNLNK